MKKISLLLIATISAINFPYSQTNTFPSNGDAGIGTVNLTGFAGYVLKSPTTCQPLYLIGNDKQLQDQNQRIEKLVQQLQTRK